ncbi:NAD(+) hydrolase SARM1-like isoform X2 [Tachypleus tridentatus]|uniref:NAD(+) hydrolase SARM1-like isoform X2 n=1 Tax=Tachypleus tridentatus TaxID=6853 RepID=UPI003FCEF8CA
MECYLPTQVTVVIRTIPHKMSDFPAQNSEEKPVSANGDVSSLVENFNQKSTVLNRINSTTASFTSSTEKLNSSSAFTSTEKLSANSSSAQMLKSSSTSSSTSGSVVSKKSQLLHSVVNQELKHQSESYVGNRNFNRSVSVTSIASSASNTSESKKKTFTAQKGLSMDDILSEETASNISESRKKTFTAQRGPSMEDVLSEETAVSTNESRKKTFTAQRGLSMDNILSEEREVKGSSPQEVTFEQKRMTKMKLLTDGFKTSNNKEVKSYQGKAIKAHLATEGFSSEKAIALRQKESHLETEGRIQQQERTAVSSTMKLKTDGFTEEKIAMSKQEEFSQASIQQQRNVSSSKLWFTSKNLKSSTAISSSQNKQQMGFGGISSSVNMSPIVTFPDEGGPFHINGFSPNLALTQGLEEDIKILNSPALSPEVEKAMTRFGSRISTCVERLKTASDEEAVPLLTTMNDIIRKAWAVPTNGYELGFNLCNILRNNGGMDILMRNCSSGNDELQFASAQLLEQCLSTENRGYVVDKGLDSVVSVAYSCSMRNSVIHSRVGTGILEHLFKHSVTTCSDVIRMGGLKAILYDCRNSDVETLRHCATALANLSLYGGSENQEAMIKHKVPVWLFPLAFNNDDNIKYYACLAIAALVANKEIEAAVLRSGTLDLVEPFVSSHNPEEFANSTVSHVHGQSKNWLLRLVPVLDSKREEARSLAAFHFAMEAGIKKRQGNTAIFHDIGAVEALKKVASSPNAIASKYAAQALQLIGEEIPHKLSQQVPLWTVEDVREWVKQINFSQYCNEFTTSRVDGDLLLQLTEEMLKEDIGIKNGILRKRFLRELSLLKRMADYSSCDSTNLNRLLQDLGLDLSQYTYPMLQCGVDKDTLLLLSEEQMAKECGVDNSIHRIRICQAIRGLAQSRTGSEEDITNSKSLDVFISYRRSNGSQLASLLKVHLQLRGFSVFIDVERLEAGKFDNNLLNSIRQAKHFLLVLTPNALDRCMGDVDCKDWVHREVVEALHSQCNIIPILDNFQWPEPETLPEDMRAVCYFNGVRWIHDYQDACVDKLERFMRGEMNVRSDGPLGRYVGMGPGTPGTPSTTLNRNALYQRSGSNDSAKGSTCSDREVTHCNGNGWSSGGSHV